MGQNGAKWDETDFARMTAPKLADMVCLEFSVNVTALGVARRTSCRLAIVLDSTMMDGKLRRSFHVQPLWAGFPYSHA